MIRLNLAPDAQQAAVSRYAPHSHLPTWRADVGGRTTWRVMAMEGYAYLKHYPRFWLRPPSGRGTHEDMRSIPQEPLLAIGCHTPGRGTGRCRADRIAQTFAHPWSASYLINPLLLKVRVRLRVRVRVRIRVRVSVCLRRCCAPTRSVPPWPGHSRPAAAGRESPRASTRSCSRCTCCA